MNKDLTDFINSQKLLTIASFDSEPWICNVYFAFDEQMKEFIFVSHEDTKHSKQIANNPKVACTTVWFDPDNLSNRKGIQCSGKCTMKSFGSEVQDDLLQQSINAYHNKFNDSKEWLTIDNIKSSDSRVYAIKLEYIKFWNDELFGEEKTQEYTI